MATGPVNIPRNIIDGYSTALQGHTEQAVGITDIISEGPIAGLVHGGKSIFLNNDSIHDDSEIGYSSVEGETVSRDSTNTQLIHINEYADELFDYDVSTEGETTGKRYILLHNVFEFEDQAQASPAVPGEAPIQFSASSSSDASPNPYAQQATTYTLVLTGDFADSVISSNTKSNMVTNYTVGEVSRLDNLSSGDGLVTVFSKDEDRKITGTISAFTATQITIKLKIGTLDNGYEWIKETDSNGRSNLKLKFSQFIKISSISGTEITTAGPVYSFSNKTFSITPVVYNDSSHSNPKTNKIRSSGYQFVPGTKDQNALTSISGTVGHTSIGLTPIRELKTGIPQTITYDGAAAGSVDTVHLLFKYPGGLYAMNMDDAKKQQAGAAYVIHLAIKNGVTGNYTDVGFLEGTGEISQALSTTLKKTGSQTSISGGVTAFVSGGVTATNPSGLGFVNINGTNRDVTAQGLPIFAHGAKSVAGIAFTHTINLEQYQPFSGFKLTIVRITESENNNDTPSARAHSWSTYAGGAGLSIDYRQKDDSPGVPKIQAVQGSQIPNAFAVIKERLNYPYTSMAHVSFNTRQFTNLPKRSYECYGLKVRIPKNYTPREKFGMITADHVTGGLIGKESLGSLPDAGRLYTGLFNGELTDHKEYTNNPAWIFHDILTNNRYGVGEYVRDADIDVFSLYKIARYCDELVSDGKGGVEPRFTANLYLQKAVDVYKVLKDMATIFRGMLYWMDGQITPIIDEPRVAVYNFNRSNVINGNFQYEFTGTKTRTNQVVVKWNNPNNEYKIEPLFVEDRDNIVKTGQVIKSESVAFGCTSEGQAIRYGRWKLWTALNQVEVVTFSTSINGAFLAPGDLINVQDNHDFGYSYGGRIKSAVRDSNGVTTVVFDRNLAEDLDGTTTAVGGAGAYTIALLLATRKVLVKRQATIETAGVQTVYSPGTPITSWFAPPIGNAPGAAVTVDQGGSGAGGAWTEEDFEKFTSNACLDMEGTPLLLEYASETHTKEVTFQQSGASGNSLGDTLTTTELSASDVAAANIGKIWALKDELETEASYKEYKILKIVEEAKGVIAISAVEHYNTKFDIIETNFTTALPDPLFPDPDPNTSLPPPTGLRILRAPKFESPGEEIVLTWDPPANTSNIRGYEVTTTIPGFEESRTTGTTSMEYDNIPEGKWTFTVSSFSDLGRVSRPAVTVVEIFDTFGGNNDRDKGLLVGGIVNSTRVIGTAVGAKTFSYEKNPVTFRSFRDRSNSGSTNVNIATGEVDYSLLGQFTSESWWSSSLLNKNSAFVFLKDYNGSSSIRLINHIADPVLNVDYWYDQIKSTTKQYNTNDPTDSGNYSFGNLDIWTSKQGKVKVDQGSAKVVGVGTNFLGDYSATSVIKFSEKLAAKVSYIESDTVMFIDRVFEYKTHNINSATVIDDNGVIKIRYFTPANSPFEVGDDVSIQGFSNSNFNTPSSGHSKRVITEVVRTSAFGEYFETLAPSGFTIANVGTAGSAASGRTTSATTSIGGFYDGVFVESDHYRDELNPDFSVDFLIGKLTAGGSFDNFCTLNADLVLPRSLVLDSNVATLNYDGTAIPNTNPAQYPLQTTYANITLTGEAIGFETPQAKVTGTGFNATTGTTFVADSDFVDVDVVSKRFTKQLAGASTDAAELFSYGDGSPLEFTVTVREKFDPSNTSKTLTKDFNIVRVKDGASGTEGRTVALTANDNTVVYNSSNTGFSLTNNASAITLTAQAFNFPSDAKYRFKNQAGDVLKDWSTSNTLVITPPNSVAGNFTVNIAGTNTQKSISSIEVEVSLNVSPEVVSATDSTPILKLGPGSPAMSISLPNNTVAVAAASDGATSGTTIPGTAAQMEVFFGSTVGKYIGTNNGTANSGGGPANDADIENGEWYIESVTDTDANLAAGNITYNGGAGGNQIISIADASRLNELSGQNESITWTIKGRDILGDIQEKSITQTIFKSLAGQDAAPATPGADGEDAYNSAGTNSSHLFISDENGIVSGSANDFATSFTVSKGGQSYTFDTVSNFAANGSAGDKKFSVTFPSGGAVNCVGSVSSTGVVTISSSNSAILTTASITTASLTVEIRDLGDSNALIQTHILRFAKVKQTVRDGATFTFSSVGTTTGAAWAGSLTDTAARTAAGLVMGASTDGFISPNDRVTLTQAATGSTPAYAATRVYTGTRTNNSGSNGPVSASSFTSKVTEFIDGSAIVSGTLSADTLAANTTISNSLNVADNLKLGNSTNSVGRIYSANKTSFSDTDAGFYMDGVGNVYIGDNTNYFKFTAGSPSSIELVAPNIQLRGPPGPPGGGGPPGPPGAASTTPGPPGSSVTITSTSSSGNSTTVNFSDGNSITIDDGDDGAAGQGVVIFYSTAASGGSVSTTQGSREFIKYVEYTGTKPTTTSSSGFVRFIGTDGTNGSSITAIYSSVQNPTSTSQLSFNPTGKEFVTFYEHTSALGNTPPSAALSETYVRFVGTNGSDGSSGFLYVNQQNTSAPSAGSIPAGTYVNGAVAIVENASGTQAAFRRSGSSWVPQVLVTADIIKAGAIGAEALEISSTSQNSTSSIFMDGSTSAGPRILVNDASGTTRVKLGRLS